jgi:branched-chain amino acid transport system permease protein
MLGLIGSLAAISEQAQIIVARAMFFGFMFTVALSIGFQYGKAGVPNLGCAVSVLVGGSTVSAITSRLAFKLVEMAGVDLLPYSSTYDWVYNNEHNVKVLVDGYLRTDPALCVALLLFTLAVSMVLGAAVGWVISAPAIRLKAPFLIIALLTMSDAVSIVSRKLVTISGGTLGVYVPDVLAFYPGDRTTARSVGKNVVGVRRNVFMFGSGIIAMAGALQAFYFSYVVHANYGLYYWTYWPLLMVVIGGSGNCAGALLGTALVMALRYSITAYRYALYEFLFFPVAYLDSLLLGALMIIFLIFRPQGLIPERPHRVLGMKYRELLSEE